MIRELLEEASAKMDSAVEHTADEFGAVRTGRANPGLLQRITVDYYGAPTPLQQIAGLSVPEPRMMLVQPYDKSSMTAIERAIQEADLGLNPSNDGSVIRLVFPTAHRGTAQGTDSLCATARGGWPGGHSKCAASYEGRHGVARRRDLGGRDPSWREGSPERHRPPCGPARRAIGT